MPLCVLAAPEREPTNKKDCKDGLGAPYQRNYMAVSIKNVGPFSKGILGGI